MESAEVIREMIEPGDYFVSFDMKNGYFHVKMDEEYHNYTCFSVDGVIYSFCALPFGLSSAPRIFTKLFKPVMAFLRSKGIRCSMYIDDVIVMANSKRACYKAANICRRLLTYIGFVIHLGKSVVIPTQSIEQLGFLWDSDNMLVSLTERRRSKCTDKISKLLAADKVTLRDIASLLCYCAFLMYRCITGQRNATSTDALQAPTTASTTVLTFHRVWSKNSTLPGAFWRQPRRPQSGNRPHQSLFRRMPAYKDGELRLDITLLRGHGVRRKRVCISTSWNSWHSTKHSCAGSPC